VQRKPHCVAVTDVRAPGNGPVEGQPAEVDAHRGIDEMTGIVKPVRDGV